MQAPGVRVVGAVALVFLFGLATGAGPAPRKPPNILLIVLDTVRYDAVTPENTPFLTSLASRGVVFTQAYSTHDFTPTSHFSMFTGLRDGLGTDDDRPQNGLPFQLGRAGYKTFATVANALVGQKAMPTLRGFADFKQIGDVHTGSGMDVMTAITEIDAQLALFRLRPTMHNRAMLYYNADRLLPVFLQQIRTTRGPYFGFINLVDAHEPYVPDPDIYEPESDLPPNFNGDVLNRRLGPELLHPESIRDPQRRAYIKSKIADVQFPRLVATDLSPRVREVYHRRYMSTIHELDDTLREFFEVLEKERRLDNTIVIITSDHGESFGEGDLITHMFRDKGDYESTHHVPLIVLLPKSLHPKAKLIERRISTANLAPTVYDLAGIDSTPFRAAHADFAPSLLQAMIGMPAHYTTAVVVPKPEKQDHTDAVQERQKALKSLGYVQ